MKFMSQPTEILLTADRRRVNCQSLQCNILEKGIIVVVNRVEYIQQRDGFELRFPAHFITVCRVDGVYDAFFIVDDFFNNSVDFWESPCHKKRVDCSLLDEQVGEQENFNCREKGISDSYALKELSVQSVCGKVNVLSGKS